MFLLHLDCSAGDKDPLIAELWERGTAGVIESDAPGGAYLSAFFDAQFDAAPFAAYHPRWEAAPEQDWVELSREQWSSVAVGERFFLVPDWSEEPVPPGRLRLEMHPGQACGTGWHAATQLCIEALERYAQPGARLLDVGTGSGILCSAAAMLGLTALYACDIDSDSVTTARDRLRGERLPGAFFVGSVRSVRDAAADLLVANINAETVVALQPEFARVLVPGGRTIVSGFPERDLDRVRRAFPAPLEVLEKDGWMALVC